MRFLVLATLLFVSPALAEEQCPEQNYNDPAKQPNFDCPSPGEESLVPELKVRDSVGLFVTEEAPWSGVLLDRNRVFLLGLRIKSLRRLRWHDIITYQEILNAEMEFLKSTHAADVKLLTTQRDNYKGQVIELGKEVRKMGAWYRSPILWFSVGVVVASAGTVTAVVLAK